MHQVPAAPVLLVLVAAAVCGSAADDLRIGIIDFYGLGRVSEREARQALAVREGDTVVLTDEEPAFVAESERRLSTVAGVARARVELVCCDAGRGIVYVGVEERGRTRTHFRVAPRRNVSLGPDVVQSGRDYEKALWDAVQRGDAAEDQSRGHALAHDPPTRAVQERFVGYAARDLKKLRDVLRESSDAEQRALAAQVLGYVAHKQEIVGDLVYGMSDPSAEVRNNSMRALALFAGMAPPSGRGALRIPAEPFVALLNSPWWTDRNKASFSLEGLTAGRDTKLLENLRRQAIGPLTEMAHWKSEGHAAAALTILGRIGGQSDEAIEAALRRGDREALIKPALER